jgi:hypothetical protein
VRCSGAIRAGLPVHLLQMWVVERCWLADMQDGLPPQDSSSQAQQEPKHPLPMEVADLPRWLQYIKEILPPLPSVQVRLRCRHRAAA